MSDYADDERETMASLNNATIRRLLVWRRVWGPLTEGQIKNLQKCLAKRRQYQRTAKIRVWELDCGDGTVLFDDKDEMLLYDPEPGDYKMIWMSGRDFGHLPIADWL